MSKTVISSNDPNAIVLLEERLIEAKAFQEDMKQVNKIIKAHPGREAQALIAAGYDDTSIKSILTKNFMGVIGYDSYDLNNNRGRIRQIETRLRDMREAQSRQSAEVQHDGFILGADAEANRVYVKFAGRQDSDTCKMMKRSGFKWAPSQDRWQRQWNNNGENAMRTVKRQLNSCNQQTRGETS